MKSRIVGAMFLLGTFAIVFSPSPGLSQRGGPPGGGDPSRIFEVLSKGRGYFMLEDTRSLREPMGRWLQQRGITDGKVTLQLFTSYMEEARSSGGMMFGKGSGGPPGMGFKGNFGPGGGPFGPGGGPFGPGGGPFGPGGPGRGGPERSSELSVAEMNRFGEMEFRRKDYNGDNLLTPEEMEPRLKEGLQSWDKNRDNLISMDEFLPFFMSKMNERGGGAASFNPVTIIIEEELLNKRPTMFRAGKDVPKEIRWFAELDTDKDGQVSFYEWRKAKKELDEFTEYDRNADGLMTAEEALHYQKKNGSTMVASSSEDSPGRSERSENGNGKGSRGSDGGNNNGGPPRFEMRSENGGGKKKGGPGGPGFNGKKFDLNNLTPEQKAKFEQFKSRFKK